jgi:hypothetical protein
VKFIKKNVAQLLGLLLAMGSSTYAAEDVSKFKVVVQLNDPNPAVVVNGLRNVQNFLKAGEASRQIGEVRVIVFGPAVAFFKRKAADTELSEAYSELSKKKQVSFFACENTLKRTKTKVQDLLPGFQTVPSGAYEVLKLQNEGFTYFRP